jgi:hypothetical protein
MREMFQQLGEYERLRMGRKVPASILDKLTQGEWHLARRGDEVTFSPVVYDASVLSVPGGVVLKSVPRPQPLHFRLQALTAMAGAGDAANISLGRSAMPIILGAPGAQTPMPGAPAGHIDLSAKPLDLQQHRGLAITLNVDGSGGGTPTPAVLNVQLEASGGSLRDYYIDLGFDGTRTVIVPQATPSRMLPEFRPAAANYPIKAALRAFNYGSVTGVSFRWMRLNGANPAHCRVLSLEALTERAAPLTGPRISIGPAAVSLATALTPGDYAEYGGEGPMRIFDAGGVLLRSLPPQPPGPQLVPGENQGRIDAAAPGRARFTAIVLGEPVPVR